MKLEKAKRIAEAVKSEMTPYCHRIEIAGSIRRNKPEVGDIEIVAIPKTYPCGLFGDMKERHPELVKLIDRWEKVKGDAATGKYTQRILPDGIKLDIFFAIPENWGLIYALRTGSAYYSYKVLASGWVKHGYHSVDGMLTIEGVVVPVRKETELFELAGVKWVDPEEREL